ncbi:hypothetical protein LYNGBM3L_24350 [Moorena producens 3L]|uniref:Uncharacterized protein n=1 Tax=Moorena producens 3L TaxID=489825 RepID=F4XNI8_9CYAN|nr:hypothetical protein LYNGBM3L_24350 [Moorena producens 3L]
MPLVNWARISSSTDGNSNGQINQLGFVPSSRSPTYPLELIPF